MRHGFRFPRARIGLVLSCAAQLALTTVVAAVDVTVQGTHGGPGQNGGDATATASSPDPTNNATATGGNGGGAANNSGAGGNARADATTDRGAGSASARATARGGAGGGHPSGANGHGGDAAGAVHAANTSDDHVYAGLFLTGGTGGFTERFQGGRGGRLDAGTIAASSTGGGDVTLEAIVTGGSGGNGINQFLNEPGTGVGGVGADALLSNSIDVATTGALKVTLGTTGGNGGDTYLIAGQNYGAAGGATSRQTLSASSESITLRTTARGGAGGMAYSIFGGNAPAGGAADARAEVANLTGPATATAEATGGRGGHALRVGNSPAARSGDGGIASAFAAADATDAGDARADATATGGETGMYMFNNDTAFTGTGGAALARARATATGTGAARAKAVATGGNSGNTTGAQATADATAANAAAAPVVAESTATGGNAQQGFGDGGHGGAAVATARGTSTGGGAVTVSVAQTGGNGSQGTFDNRNGGNGADSLLNNAAAGSTSGPLSLRQDARAGNAGASSDSTVAGSTPGRSGLPGVATSVIDLTDTSAASLGGTVTARGGDAAREHYAAARAGGAANASASLTGGAGSVTASAHATGGNGGTAGFHSSYQSVYTGGDGGAANIPLVSASGAGDVTAAAVARGGNGGLGYNRGGSGGAATVGPVTAVSTGGGRATATIDVTGGHGAEGGFLPGDGQSVSLTNRVAATTSGQVVLRQYATGGRAGFTQSAGQSTYGTAGEASSTWTGTLNNPAAEVDVRATAGDNDGLPVGRAGNARADVVNPGGDLTLSATSRGGRGASVAIQAGTGGPALAELRGAAAGALLLTADATGGDGASFGGFGLNHGNGGDGGDATADAVGTTTFAGAGTISATARGGTSGYGHLYNTATDRGGKGGRADARAVGTVGGGTLVVNASAFGGAGGVAQNQGNVSGAGGDAFARESAGYGADFLRLTQSATGADSPASGWGGGSAVSSTSFDAGAASQVVASVTATGGGRAYNTSAGTGGDATAVLHLSADGDLALSAGAFAGHTRRNDATPGGATTLALGGTSRAPSGLVVLSGTASGGKNYGAGPGASVALDNVVSGQTGPQGTVAITQVAEGGNALRRGGDASSTLTATKSVALFRADATARAGTSYVAQATGFATADARSEALIAPGHAGVAQAIAVATGGRANSSSSGADASAGGGSAGASGGSGTVPGGHATATAVGSGTGTSGAPGIAEARALGGKFGDATADATFTGGGAIQVVAHAEGDATIIGSITADNLSRATARGTSSGTPAAPLSVAATAVGGNNGLNAPNPRGGGDALASAAGTHPGAAAVAALDVAATAQGGRGLTAQQPAGAAVARAAGDTSSASGPGAGGSVRALASSSGGPLVSIRADSLVPARVSDVAEARASVARPFTQPGALAGLQAASVGVGRPLQTDLADALANNPNVTAALGPAAQAGDVLALAAFASEHPAESPFGGSYAYVANLELDVDPAQLGARNPLSLGLLDPALIGAGFDALRLTLLKEGQTILDQTFASAAAALEFFDDRVLTFGRIDAGVSGLIDLDVRFAFTSGAPGGFSTTLMVVNAPEPAVGAMVLAGATLLARRRVTCARRNE